ncbi:hypothetical protein ACFVU2_16300 [Leifsonia sp. NPDC058194]|uniref:hypothetical protein n=1 Tax=Leifsonia sp. NPDC058194 TaxID=3346374 RepID=UPI0036D83DB0
MSAGITTTAPTPGAGTRVRGDRVRLAGRDLPWWGATLIVYASSRILTTVFMLSLYVAATVGHWSFASSRHDPTFFTFSSSWDGSFYQRIATGGYPTTLPVDGGGDVQQNPWAFLPLYPVVVRGLMAVTGLPFAPAGVAVATLFGAAAALVLFRIVHARGGTVSALWATVFFCFGPLSFVLQITYAESMFFFLMFAALLAMIRRRYWLVIPFTVAAAFAKPGALAIPLALAVVFVVRLIQNRRGTDVFGLRERIAVLAAGAITAVAGLAWPLVASQATGTPDAYVSTELSWWTGFVGHVSFVPLTPWFLFTWKYAGVAGVLLVVAAIAGFVWLLRRPGVRALGTEVVAYSASYGLYLVAVFLPQQSLFRLLLPLAPLGGARGLTHSPRARTIVFAVGVALQPVALILLWFLGYP